MIGETLGSYRILRKLGEGGMGVVYLAEHALIGRLAAVKLLLPMYSSHGEIVNRFFNEARTTALIKHAGLVDIFDFGFHHSGSAYLVMEFLEGESLASRLQRERRLPVEVALAVTRQMAGAIGAAHLKGIIHRDLKPDNVFLVPESDAPMGARVKVLDFGIAKLQAADAGTMKTRTGSVMGTPMYMSPEQCRGSGNVHKRADVYSLGCILFEMLLGRTVFLGEGPGEIIASHLRESAPAARALDPAIPVPVDALVGRMLAKRPEDRQQSMEELIADIDRLSNWRYASGVALGHPPPAHTSDPALAHAAATVAVPVVSSAQVSAAPTTLSGASAEVQASSAPTRSRNKVMGIAAAVTLGLIAGIVIVATQVGKKKSTPAGAQVAAAAQTGTENEKKPDGDKAVKTPPEKPVEPKPEPKVEPPKPEPPKPEPVKEEPPPPEPVKEELPPPEPPKEQPKPEAPVIPQAPEAPIKIKHTLRSDPAGAEVYRFVDNVRLGKTPLEGLELTSAPGEAVYVLKLSGYRDEKITLRADTSADAEVNLKAKPKIRKPKPHGPVNPF